MEDTPEAGLADAIPPGMVIICLVMAGLNLVAGWLGGIEGFVRIRLGFSAMAPSTALSFILISAAFLLAWQCEAPKARTAWRLCYAVIALALINIAINLGLGRHGLDGLLLTPGDGVAIATSLGFLLAAYCVIALTAPENPDPDGPALVGLLGASTSLAVVAGYIFDPNSMDGIYLFAAMSPLTATLLAIFFVAVVAWPHARLGAVVYRR